MKFKHLPTLVDAVRYDGSSAMKADIQSWMTGGNVPTGSGSEIKDAKCMNIPTAHGMVRLEEGDWLIKSSLNHYFYPCSDDAFKQLYKSKST